MKNHRPLLLQRPVVLCTFFGKILFAQEAESGQQIGAAPQRRESGRRICGKKSQPQIEKQGQKKNTRAAGERDQQFILQRLAARHTAMAAAHGRMRHSGGSGGSDNLPGIMAVHDAAINYVGFLEGGVRAVQFPCSGFIMHRHGWFLISLTLYLICLATNIELLFLYSEL